MRKIFANYDWDDNIIYMPTRIILFSKDPNARFKEVAVSTETFAHTRSVIGLNSKSLMVKVKNSVVIDCPKGESADGEVDLLDYKIIDGDTGSFREFRDCSNNYFLRDLKVAVEQNQFGASFKDFVEHCSTPELAENVTIITARGHAPETIHSGCVVLKELGLINYVPKVENIYPCSFKNHKSKLVASAANPSDAKKNILLSILDFINEKSKVDKSFYSFGFSDDDKKTMNLVEESLSQEILKGRWSNFEINLYFTGNKVKERKTLLSAVKAA